MTLQPRGFPPLKPTTRSQTFGVFPESRFDDLTGFDIRFKRGETAVKHRLTLTFAELTEAEAKSVFAHYRSVRGGFVPFAFTESETFCGDSSPLFDQWRYLARPVSVDRPGDFYDLTCEFVAFTQDLPTRTLGAAKAGETVSIVDAGAGEDYGEPNGAYFRVDQNTVEVKNDATLKRAFTFSSEPAVVEVAAPGKFERAYYFYPKFATTLLYQKNWADTKSEDETRRLPSAATNVEIVDEPATFDQAFAASPHGSGRALKLTDTLTNQSDYRFDIPLGAGGAGEYLLVQFWWAIDANSPSSFAAPGCVRNKTTGTPLCEFTFDTDTGENEIVAFDANGDRITFNDFNFNDNNTIPGNAPGEPSTRKYILATWIKDAQGVAVSYQVMPALAEFSAPDPYFIGWNYSYQDWNATYPEFDLSATQLELVLGSNASGEIRFDGFLLGYRVDIEPIPGYDRQKAVPPEWDLSDSDLYLAAIPGSIGNDLNNPVVTEHPDFPTEFRPGIQEPFNTIFDHPLPVNTVEATNDVEFIYQPLVNPPEAWLNQPITAAIGSNVVAPGVNNSTYQAIRNASGGVLSWLDPTLSGGTGNATPTGTNNDNYVVTIEVVGDVINFGDVAEFGALTASATPSGTNNISYEVSRLTNGPVASFAGNDAFSATGAATLAP